MMQKRKFLAKTCLHCKSTYVPTGCCQKYCENCKREMDLQRMRDRHHATYVRKGYNQSGENNNRLRPEQVVAERRGFTRKNVKTSVNTAMYKFQKFLVWLCITWMVTLLMTILVIILRYAIVVINWCIAERLLLLKV